MPPPPGELLETLSRFERYLHAGDELPFLIRLALIHYQFEAIHPFIDGNGRVGRLLITFLLVYWKLLPLPLLYLSAYFEQHREEYYQYLLEVSADGKWRQWIIFFLKGVAEQADDAIVRARRLQDLQNTWRDKLSQARTSTSLLRLAEHLFEEPVITIPRAARVLGLTYAAARHHVQRLVNEEILVPLGDKSYGRTFACFDIFDVLSAGIGE